MKNQQSGFTLIEVMIIVVILGTLAAIAYPNYTKFVKDGHLTKAKSNILAIDQSMQRYYSQKSTFINASIPTNLQTTEKFDFALATTADGSACHLTETGSDKYCIIARPNEDYKEQETRTLIRSELGQIYLCSSPTSCKLQ